MTTTDNIHIHIQTISLDQRLSICRRRIRRLSVIRSLRKLITIDDFQMTDDHNILIIKHTDGRFFQYDKVITQQNHTTAVALRVSALRSQYSNALMVHP